MRCHERLSPAGLQPEVVSDITVSLFWAMLTFARGAPQTLHCPGRLPLRELLAKISVVKAGKPELQFDGRVPCIKCSQAVPQASDRVYR